ncbi:MAG: hypothetical protein PVS3B2_21460 [Candidatus Dormibacteraceae bacterium]
MRAVLEQGLKPARDLTRGALPLNFQGVKQGNLLSTWNAPRTYTSSIKSDGWRTFANSAEFRSGLSMGIQAVRDLNDVAKLCADHGLQSSTFASMEAARKFDSE